MLTRTPSQITAARRSVSRQYIMITPNAIEGRATLDKDVKIIRCVVLLWRTALALLLSELRLTYVTV